SAGSHRCAWAAARAPRSSWSGTDGHPPRRVRRLRRPRPLGPRRAWARAAARRDACIGGAAFRPTSHRDTRPLRGAAVSVSRIEWPESGIAHLVMDDPERKLNVLDEGAISDLEQRLRELEHAAELRGVVLRSGKPGS